MVPGVFFVAAMLFQPESPRWLVEHHRYDEAARSLAYVGRTTVDDKAILLTIEEIKADFAGKHHMSMMKQLAGMAESRSIALRCFIPSLVMFFQQVC